MPNTNGGGFGGATAAAALGLLLLGAPRDRCRYTNPQYAGACVVERAKGETCASILAYLNDPRSQGKSYCGNTSVRGGWIRVKGATKRPSPVPSPSPTAK